MAIILTKNKTFSIPLTKTAAKVHAGLSWDKTIIGGIPADLDLSVVMLAANNKLPADEYFVFFNNKTSADGSVVHQGDNRDGAGDGDDEVVAVDLGKVDAAIVQMLFVVTIHESEARGHNFGNVQNAAIRILKDSASLCEYTMTESAPEADAIIIGRMMREGHEWNFEALTQCFEGGLGTIVGLYN